MVKRKRADAGFLAVIGRQTQHHTITLDVRTCLILESLVVVTVQSLSCIWFFATPWTAAHQAFLSFTDSWSLLKLMSIDSVMPSNNLILFCPVSASNLSQHQGLFQWISSSHQVAKVLEFQLPHQSFWWIFMLISFRIDWFDLLAVQGTLKSLLQHHSSKTSILWCSALFMVQPSHPNMTNGKP